jgi:hypothetical protein
VVVLGVEGGLQVLFLRLSLTKHRPKLARLVAFLHEARSESRDGRRRGRSL